ncbi:selenium binding protein [Nannochloropsis gaditana]|uniref:Selenium binding protein n=1 Tax=Nannochloropsis gaditana TaxID=72520 RepID=W7U1L8_9STRA|nr:selenium binding protein [Nannochloropsis gaditana]
MVSKKASNVVKGKKKPAAKKVKKAAKTAPAAKKASLPTKKAPAAKKPVAATSSVPIKEASGSLPKEAGTNGKVSSIVVEACKQCQCFKKRAEILEQHLKVLKPELKFVLNPERPTKGVFIVRTDTGEVLWSMTGLTRPFQPLKAVDFSEAQVALPSNFQPSAPYEILDMRRRRFVEGSSVLDPLPLGEVSRILLAQQQETINYVASKSSKPKLV